MKITIDTQNDSKQDIKKAITFLNKLIQNQQSQDEFNLPEKSSDDDGEGIFGAFTNTNSFNDDDEDDDEPKIEIVNF